MKKAKKLLLLSVCLLLGAGIFGQTGMKAEASGGYRKIEFGGTKTVKSGKYYLRLNSSRKLCVSESKNGDYKETSNLIDGIVFSNGKQIYYVDSNVMYKYVFSSGKTSVVKRLPVKGDEYYYISTVYGSRVFLTKSSFNQWKFWTYSYDVKKKKLKKVKTDCAISDRYGRYVVAQKEFRSDVSPYTITLYKITGGGLSKVRTLTTRCHAETFLGGKLYYTVYSNQYMNKVTLYKCNAKNGKGRTKIRTFESKKSPAGYYSGVFVMNITSKKCEVSMNESRYQYTYKTKKLKKLKNPY